MTGRNIYLIEDEVLTIENLTLILTQAGYEIIGSAMSGEEALVEIPRLKPDLVIIDVRLSAGGGQFNGIQTAHELDKVFQVPYLFLTGLEDQVTFNQTLQTKAYTRVSKPFNESDLIFSVSRALENNPGTRAAEKSTALQEFLLVKSGAQHLKIMVRDIQYVEADKAYLHIFTLDGKKHTASMSLAQFERNYHFPDLLRVSRSHFVNVRHIDYFEEPSTLVVHATPINVGKTYRKGVKNLLPFLRTGL